MLDIIMQFILRDLIDFFFFHCDMSSIALSRVSGYCRSPVEWPYAQMSSSLLLRDPLVLTIAAP